MLVSVQSTEKTGVSALKDAEIEKRLHPATRRLGVPWNLWARVNRRRLKRLIHAEVDRYVSDFARVSAREREEVVGEAVERVIAPYRNRLTLIAYGFLLGAVGMNAFVVTRLAGFPSLATFAATFGGTLAGALGFQVIARLQAWAKQISSNGAFKTEQIPFNTHAFDIWRRSQQLKSDLPRDGRNIRKDSWLQLHPRLEKALVLPLERDALEAVADALVDHRQTYGEVQIDFWLAREFHRNLKQRFSNETSYQAIRRVFRETHGRHGLPLEDLDRMLDAILRPETWRRTL